MERADDTRKTRAGEKVSEKFDWLQTWNGERKREFKLKVERVHYKSPGGGLFISFHWGNSRVCSRFKFPLIGFFNRNLDLKFAMGVPPSSLFFWSLSWPHCVCFPIGSNKSFVNYFLWPFGFQLCSLSGKCDIYTRERDRPDFSTLFQPSSHNPTVKPHTHIKYRFYAPSRHEVGISTQF